MCVCTVSPAAVLRFRCIQRLTETQQTVPCGRGISSRLCAQNGTARRGREVSAARYFTYVATSFLHAHVFISLALRAWALARVQLVFAGLTLPMIQKAARKCMAARAMCVCVCACVSHRYDRDGDGKLSPVEFRLFLADLSRYVPCHMSASITVLVAWDTHEVADLARSTHGRVHNAHVQTLAPLRLDLLCVCVCVCVCVPSQVKALRR